jgi:hypothetical protein
VDIVLRKILRTALRHGVADQHWAWLVMGGCAFILRRSLRGNGAVVSSLHIAPGEQVMISVRDRSTESAAVVAAATTTAAVAPTARTPEA